MTRRSTQRWLAIKALVAARDAENRSWDQANLELTDSHTAEKKELQEAFDVKVEEEKRLQEAVRIETAELRQQFREEKVLVEEDADNEVDDEKASYESKLITEKRLTQKLRDENGLSEEEICPAHKRCGGPEGGDGVAAGPGV